MANKYYEICQSCHGKGIIPGVYNIANNVYEAVKCANCGGNGYLLLPDGSELRTFLKTIGLIQ